MPVKVLTLVNGWIEYFMSIDELLPKEAIRKILKSAKSIFKQLKLL